jgi:hypothetical protein
VTANFLLSTIQTSVPLSLFATFFNACQPGKNSGLNPDCISKLRLAHPLFDVNQSLHKALRTDAGGEITGSNRIALVMRQSLLEPSRRFGSPLLPLWPFVACYRMNVTFTLCTNRCAISWK